MVNLTIEQVIKGIQHFLHHLYAQDSIADMMRISIRLSQLESGRGEGILMHPEQSSILYLTPTWITNMRLLVHGNASFKHRNDLSMVHSASTSTQEVYHGNISRTANRLFTQTFSHQLLQNLTPSLHNGRHNDGLWEETQTQYLQV